MFNWNKRSCVVVGHRYNGLECMHCGKKDVDQPDSWDLDLFYRDLTEKFHLDNKKKERLIFLEHCYNLNNETVK